MAGRRLVLAYLCLVSAALLAGAHAAGVEFNYGDQSAWLNFPNSACGGMRQSPIDVVTGSVTVDSTLTPLQFSPGWDQSRSGTMLNTANTIKFTPSAGAATTTTTTPAGEYALQQFHFHWGRNDGQGSEHLVDGRAYAGELHFVHRRQPAGPADAGDAFAVVGVLLEADGSLSLAGSPWEFMVPVARGSNASVSGIVYSDFLPAATERDYYFYPGSLTTPLCSEVVQWLLLKEPVRVPAALFRLLRTVQSEAGPVLTFNYRNTQPLNGRLVRTAGALPAAAAVTSLWLLAAAFFFGLLHV